MRAKRSWSVFACIAFVLFALLLTLTVSASALSATALPALFAWSWGGFWTFVIYVAVAAAIIAWVIVTG